jgi:hypothetical protein
MDPALDQELAQKFCIRMVFGKPRYVVFKRIKTRCRGYPYLALGSSDTLPSLFALSINS